MEGSALSGVKVLDMSRLVAGNMATLQLADFGADVIKVERPKVGDPLRQWRKGNLDLWWREYARNKRSLALDITSARGRELLLALVQRCDVLVENFIPGKLDELNLSYATLLAANPGLVILSITAWGHDGPTATGRASAPWSRRSAGSPRCSASRTVRRRCRRFPSPT